MHKQLQKELLLETSVNLKIVYFIGFFENNPFVSTDESGNICLCLPVETHIDKTIEKIRFYHELTHIFHAQICHIDFTYQRSLAFLIIQEGIALQMSKKMVPGFETDSYVSHQKGWYNEMKDNHKPIFQEIKSHTTEDSSDILYKYTMGQGSTGHEREAYYVGWCLVGRLLEEGYTFLDLMLLDEHESNVLVDKYIDKLMLLP